MVLYDPTLNSLAKITETAVPITTESTIMMVNWTGKDGDIETCWMLNSFLVKSIASEKVTKP